MCKSNSSSQVCGIPLTTYTAKQSTGIKPTIFFCETIRGAIVHALLDRVSNGVYPQSSSAPFAADILSNKAFFKKILSYCHLDFIYRDKAGFYASLIVPAWKNTIKWMQRKMVEFGIVENVEGKWIRKEGFVFGADESAGKWFNEALAKLQEHNKMYPAVKDEMNLDDGMDLDDGMPCLASLAITDGVTVEKRLPIRNKVKRLQSRNKPRSAVDASLAGDKKVKGRRGGRGI